MNPVKRFEDIKYTQKGSRGVSKLKTELLRGITNKKILDIGCGSGEVCRYVNFFDNEVTGIDISEIAVKKAKIKGINAFCCDVDQDIPIKERFDYVLMFDVLEHVIDPIGLLNKAYGLLTSNGKLIITVPNEMSLIYKINALVGRSFQEKIYKNCMFAEHHTIFSRRLANIIMDKSKFTDYKITMANYSLKYLVSQTIVIECEK